MAMSDVEPPAKGLLIKRFLPIKSISASPLLQRFR